jgi:hypothetical protein
MKRLVEFPSESGKAILVEVEEGRLGGEMRRGLSPSAVVERAQTSFEDALDKARPIPRIRRRIRVLCNTLYSECVYYLLHSTKTYTWNPKSY